MEKISIFSKGKLTYVDFKRTKNKNAYLKITKDNKLLITAPEGIPIKSIKEFVELHIDRFSKYIDDAKEYELFSIDKKYVYHLGRKLAIEILSGFTDINYKIKNNVFYALTPSNNDEEVTLSIKMMLKNELEEYLEANHEKFEKLIGVPKHHFSVRYKISNWGVNSVGKFKISYSSRLMHFNKSVIDYLMVHELSHYIVPNHSNKFWEIVADKHPTYKEDRRQLKSNKRPKK